MSPLRLTWLIDSFTFSITGPRPAQFLTKAAARSLRLWGIRSTAGRCTATARGADYAALAALAQAGGWQLSVQNRRGPGPVTTALLRRPGLPVGLLLFAVLLRLFGGFIWCIDFGESDPAALRPLLAACGLYEGAHLTEADLAAARQQAAAQTDRYGWISINFTGGCLGIETAPSHFMSVRSPAADAALYAAAGGEVLAVETQSGFAAVAPGQYVAAGQLLVDHIGVRRSGSPFTQGAAGRVIARVVRSYTAEQPFTAAADLLTGARTERLTLYLFGTARPLPTTEQTSPAGDLQVEWLPLYVGRAALPGCLYRATYWERQRTRLQYTAAQAAALAARACRAKLMAEFPDAVIETQQRTDHAAAHNAHCTIRYTFRANIAAAQEA